MAIVTRRELDNQCRPPDNWVWLGVFVASFAVIAVIACLIWRFFGPAALPLLALIVGSLWLAERLQGRPFERTSRDDDWSDSTYGDEETHE